MLNISNEINIINLFYYYNHFYNIISKIKSSEKANIIMYIKELNNIIINIDNITGYFSIIEKNINNNDDQIVEIDKLEIEGIIDYINRLLNLPSKLQLNLLTFGLKNIDTHISVKKLIKIRCLKHKLLYEIIENNIIPKIQTIVDNILIPTNAYIKCIRDKVTDKILSKVLSTTLKEFITSTNFLYTDYTQFSLYNNFIRIFFQNFFKNPNCYFITDIYISVTNKQIKYNYNIFDIIKKSDKIIFFIFLELPMHANILIIDKSSKNIFHFEPNGFNYYINDNILLNKWINKILNYDWHKNPPTLEEYITQFILETEFNKIPETNTDDNPDSYFYDSKLLLLFNNMLPDYKYYSTYSVARPDNRFIPYVGDMKGIDPGGYCKTSVYFYVFILMLNIPIEPFTPIFSPDKPDLLLNPILSSDKISIIMIKWIHTTEHNKPDYLLILRNFATIIFQYYYKFINSLFHQLTTITININDTNRDYDTVINFIQLKKNDVPCKDTLIDDKLHTDLNIITSINYSINSNSVVEVKFNNSMIINYKNNEDNCNNYLNQEIAKWYFISILFFNPINAAYKDIYCINHFFKIPSDEGKFFIDVKTDCQNNYPFQKKYLKYKIKYLKLTNLI